MKLVDASLKVNVIVAVSPKVRLLSLVLRAIVGGVVSVGIDRKTVSERVWSAN